MNYFSKRFFKNSFRAFTAVVSAAAMGISGVVFADGAEKAELTAAGDTAEVILTLPQAAAEEVSSLQISLNVNTNTENSEISFVPNEKLAAKFTDSRYHKDTGVLNIYTVGTKPLFDKTDPTITLGYVIISSAEVNGAAANVGFVKDSVKYVRGSSLVVYGNELTYSETVTISVGNGGAEPPPPITEPQVTSSSEENNSPAVTYPENNDPSQSGSGENPFPAASEPSVIISAGEGEDQPQPVDFTALSEALASAKEYKAADYTDDSYKTLQEAISKAEELMSDPLAVQDQADEIRMLLENAIGMLSPKSKSPAAEQTAAKSEEPTDTAALEDPPSETTSVSYAGEQSDSFNPLIIVLIVVGVILAPLTVGIVLVLGKKKGSGGKHSK